MIRTPQHVIYCSAIVLVVCHQSEPLQIILLCQAKQITHYRRYSGCMEKGKIGIDSSRNLDPGPGTSILQVEQMNAEETLILRERIRKWYD